LLVFTEDFLVKLQEIPVSASTVALATSAGRFRSFSFFGSLLLLFSAIIACQRNEWKRSFQVADVNGSALNAVRYSSAWAHLPHNLLKEEIEVKLEQGTLLTLSAMVQYGGVLVT
jgi:hypothetical protein